MRKQIHRSKKAPPVPLEQNRSTGIRQAAEGDQELVNAVAERAIIVYQNQPGWGVVRLNLHEKLKTGRLIRTVLDRS